jgi:hypothetical protein
MVSKEIEKPILSLDGTEYDIDSMDDNQKEYINHLSDLDRKLKNAQFNMTQLMVNKEAFVSKLRDSLKDVKPIKKEPVK